MHRSLDQEEEEPISVRDPDFAYQSDEDPEHNDTAGDDEFEPQHRFDDEMVSLRLDQQKMLAVILWRHSRSAWV